MIAEIIFENERLLALNKASGVHTLRGKDSSSPNLQDWLEAQRPSQSQLLESGFLQRLDYLTSGCILAAKDEKSFSEFKQKMKQSDFFEKIYLVVTQRLIENQETLFYFQSRYRSSKKISVSDFGDPKDLGKTKIELLHSQKDYFVYQANIVGGGKRHQIRASFAKLGAPIVGDPLYGGSESNFFGLHSWRLECPDFQMLARPPFASLFSALNLSN